MKTHTNEFKDEIKKLGKQLDSKIIYQLNGETIELGNNDLNSVTPHYESNILKSVMKEIEIDSNVEIPVGTEINYQFGLLVNGSYEYLDFGKYVVKEIEKQEDTNSWFIKCCDKMLYAMKEYEKLEILYPITIKDYLQAICNKLGLAFENAYGTFANYDKQIEHELYLSYNETTQDYTDSMGYTFRDVLDEIAEATGSTILINNDDKLEVRYIEPDPYEEKTIEAKNDLYISDAKASENVLSYSVDGVCSQDGTPTPDSPVEVKTIPSIINLFDKENTSWYRNGNSAFSNTTNTSTSRIRTNSFLIKGGKSYTISGMPNGISLVAVRTYETNGGENLGNATLSGNTITLNSNVNYINIVFGGSNFTDSTNELMKNTNLMLEEGSVVHEYVPYGYWSKVKVTGKNLFDKNNTSWYRNNGTGFVNTNNTSTTQIRTNSFAIESGKTYVVSGIPEGITLYRVRTFSEYGGTYVRTFEPTNDSFTLNNDEIYIHLYFSGTGFTDETNTLMANANIQLEEGSTTPTTYEPYKENQVLIDMSKENLFDINNTISSSTRATGSVSNDVLTVTTSNTGATASYITIQINNSDDLLGKTVTLSANMSTNGGVARMTLYGINSSGAPVSNRGTITSSGSITITLPNDYPENCVAWGIGFNSRYNSVGSIGSTATYSNVYLFEGDNPTPYYELCKIGNYKDTLSIDSSGNVSITKNISKVVFNGSEDGWSVVNNVFYRTENSTLISDTVSVMSNYFVGANSQTNTSAVNNNNPNNSICNSSNANYKRFYIKTSVVSTTNDFKTWLSTHNTDVYYVLATPETINLPNTKIPLFEGINHITFVDNLETDTKVVYNTPTLITEDIDEEYLKDVNVNFGEKYGPVNSIVLSRAGDSDKVYLRDEQSVTENGLCEINISENQIMNWNDRSDYLPDLLEKLDGLEYYLNDFTSTGITYLDPCDRYYVHIEEKVYPCIMFNDEVDVTQGLQELVHTDMLEQSETDYTKADKTDRKLNQTTLIVDKQNQTIQSVVSNVTEQNNKISQITQTVDELNSKIQDIADITVAGESQYATFTLDGINESEPIMIKVRPLSAIDNISYLYPSSGLYPSSNLYGKTRTIRFHNDTENEDIDYILPDDLLYYDSTHFDEFYLDYDSQTCQITKKCKWNADGTVGLLDNERTDTYPYPTINLTNGDYTLQLLGYQYGYLFVRLMASNIYTSQFATRVEVTSQINQTASEINLEVAKKTNKDEIISTINQTAEQIQINANKISLAGKTINMTSDNIAINSTNFQVDKNGNITANNGNFVGNINAGSSINLSNSTSDTDVEFVINSSDGSQFYARSDMNYLYTKDRNEYISNRARDGVQDEYGNIHWIVETLWQNELDSSKYTKITAGKVVTNTVIQGSLKEIKKNFEKLDSGLDIIKNIDVYKYHLKSQNDDEKKHIGFVIGDNYKYSEEVTSNDNNGVDIYSFVSVCCKAIQEQQEQINSLKEEIKKLKEGDK